jgi:hypothetical protein
VSNIQNQLTALIQVHGLRETRRSKHVIYRSRPDVNRETFVWVTSSTPSDGYFTPHNQLKSLKEAIRRSQESEVVAISIFERAEADAKIAAQAKKVAQAAGAAGTRKKSTSTGYFYVETGRTLAEMSQERREAHLKASAEAAAAQKAKDKAEREARMAERAMTKDFIDWMFRGLAYGRKVDMDEYNGALAYKTAAARSIRRALAGKRISLHKKPADQDYRAVESAKLSIRWAFEDIPEIVEEIRKSAHTYSDEKSWAKGRRGTPSRIPYAAELNLSVKSLLENYEAWNIEALFGGVFAEYIKNWIETRERDFDALQDYVRANSLELITATQSCVHQNILADLGKKLRLDSYTGPEWAAGLLADGVVAFQKDWEARQLAKPEKEMCQLVRADRLQTEPTLRTQIAAVRRNIRAMVRLLAKLDAVIRKI